MSSNPASAKQSLIDLLGSAASYNDKGFEWCGHNADKVAAMQRNFQIEQLELARQIAPAILGSELLSAIESGAASRDWSGRYAELAEQVLGVRRHGP